jgi:hypothetical protein
LRAGRYNSVFASGAESAWVSLDILNMGFSENGTFNPQIDNFNKEHDDLLVEFEVLLV